MKRKLIKQANSAYTVTLPIKWVRENNLEAGTEIDVDLIDHDIVITVDRKPTKSEYTLKITSQNEYFIRVLLNNLYRKGYDKVTITYESKKQYIVIKDITKKLLLGFEITSHENNKVIIENITEPNDEKQEILLRRMFLMIKESLTLLQNDLKDKSFNNFTIVKENTEKVGAYDNFCRRNISKKKFSEKNVNFYWGLYNYLLLIQHSILHLYEHVPLNKTLKLSPSVIKIPPQLLHNFDQVYTGHFKKDITLIKRSNNKSNVLLNDVILKKTKKSPGEEAIILYYFGELARTIYLTSAPIIGILMS
jgi:antitoxin component of MazEF toxin-antitoxin module